MLIGEVSEKIGLSRDTIRFYEKRGLICVGRRNSGWNNYKSYKKRWISCCSLKRPRQYRSRRNSPVATSCRMSRLVAAMIRTSTLIDFSPPTLWNSRCSSTRRSFVCVVSGISPISSRKIVPPSPPTTWMTHRSLLEVKVKTLCNDFSSPDEMEMHKPIPILHNIPKSPFRQ